MQSLFKIKVYEVIIEQITLKIKAIDTKKLITYYSFIFYQELSAKPEAKKKMWNRLSSRTFRESMT